MCVGTISPTENVDSMEPSYFSESGVAFWTPICPDQQKPFIGQKFLSPDDVVKFYENNAQIAGFDVRSNTTISSDGVVKLTHLLCHHQGFKRQKTEVDTLKNPNSKQRKRKETRCGCEAKLYFKLVDGGMHLSIDKQNFIMDLGHMRIGATRVFHLVKVLVGGYSNIGATLTDFKIFKRDMKAFIGGRDAEMVVTHLKNKRDYCKGYVFEYVADEKGTLTRLFWADSKSVKDRETFVDVVSFDATYSTNKYNLVFVPFTGVDNNKRSVTLAICLISNEDEDSYTWLLECFRKSISHLPSVLVTDQDAAMKAAIAKIFPESTHRFCMWHIAEKMKAKVLALDTQRNHRWTLDTESNNYSPILKTELDIERHAANIFTHNIFKEFQNEIFAGVSCISSTKDARCSCSKSETTGILCRHVFHVFCSMDVSQIPSAYILNRWLKSASSVQELVPECSHPNQEVASVTTEIWTLVRSAISQSGSDLTNLRSILENVKQLKNIIQVPKGMTNGLSKADYFKTTIGMEQPSQVNIKPPKVARNKGCGKRHRTTREVMIEKANIPKRLCGNCQEFGHHNKQSCPKKTCVENLDVNAQEHVSNEDDPHTPS
ncbi:hypothetical protein QQ045_028110 [Rhodiola kirilowii]